MSILEFRKNNFLDLNNFEIGQQLWDFLNEHDNIIYMKAACYFKKPAAQIMSEPLRSKFSGHEFSPNEKQLVGYMIRQILENEGFEIDKGKVIITDEGNLFSTATRYKKVQTNNINK